MKNEEVIVKELRKDSRQSIADISKNTGMSLSRVFSRIKNLEARAIRKYTILLDYHKLGYNLRVFLGIKTKRKRELKRFLLKHPNVNTIGRTTNTYDFFVECIFVDMKGFIDFKEELQSRDVRPQIFYVIEDIKKEAFLCNGTRGQADQ